MGRIMEQWYSSKDCESRVHCKNCRLSKDFRDWIFKNYSGLENPEFECPFGITKESINQQFPSLTEEVKNAAMALMRVSKAIVEGEKVRTTEEEVRKRLKICESNKCGQFFKSRCLKCGCYTKLKIKLYTESCPLGYWGKGVKPNPT